MSQKVDPVVHDLAVLLASQSDRQPSEDAIKKFYGNYLVAVKTLTALSKDEEFKANPFPPPIRKHKMQIR